MSEEENDYCLRCEMPKAYCPHGNAEAARAVEEEFSRVRRSGACTQGEDGPTIEASIRTECVTCGGQIELGDRITHIRDGWVHADPPPPTSSTDMFEGIV